MSVVPFPRADRDRREYLLRVAAVAAPLLQAAAASGNATMVVRVFEALGAVAANDDALTCLDALQTRDGDVLPIRR